MATLASHKPYYLVSIDNHIFSFSDVSTFARNRNTSMEASKMELNASVATNTRERNAMATPPRTYTRQASSRLNQALHKTMTRARMSPSAIRCGLCTWQV